jgi:hypothetical protein
MTGLAQQIGDPYNRIVALGGSLDSARDAVVGELNAFRSSRQSGPSVSSSSPAIASDLLNLVLNNSLGRSMLDKLTDVLPSLPAGVNELHIPGFNSALDRFVAHTAALAGDAVPDLGDFEVVVEGLISSDGLLSAPLDPLLDVISSHVIQSFDDLNVMLVDGAAVVQAATRSVGAFLDWLDSEVYILGFSKFYEGLTGGTFSPLDVICLLAAIVPVPSVGEDSRDINDGALCGIREGRVERRERRRARAWASPRRSPAPSACSPMP